MASQTPSPASYGLSLSLLGMKHCLNKDWPAFEWPFGYFWTSPASQSVVPKACFGAAGLIHILRHQARLGPPGSVVILTHKGNVRLVVWSLERISEYAKSVGCWVRLSQRIQMLFHSIHANNCLRECVDFLFDAGKSSCALVTFYLKYSLTFELERISINAFTF